MCFGALVISIKKKCVSCAPKSHLNVKVFLLKCMKEEKDQIFQNSFVFFLNTMLYLHVLRKDDCCLCVP